ncbi:2Fe-2S iron-sulfur cluster-binding protein [Amorphus orientalis]|uniref:NADPH-dependent 2,4-dienoyl-CoA reductase/sulfur reductase-like enzyme n=1 Tax=Amorphus orientalis TaxID=649198 RepID=A0AAE4AU81_9HYPH|nr:2Fe-2S iron-sulfur cluster-binding protein [Amorphus orientalis]MDQ0316842.1 NADPH-dependent 2,4-dienoyl-CoA reductase/sulfur reductase-like enzyme [Amorphus orientalis]
MTTPPPAGDVPFVFNRRRLVGRTGDTLAAALLRNGILATGFSPRRRRPRGIITAGFDEPAALVHRLQPSPIHANARATTLPLAPGLEARGAHADRLTAFAIAGLARFTVAGFYHKLWTGARAWHAVEPMLRRLASDGPIGSQPDAFSVRRATCDVLVVGDGPAGRAATVRLRQEGKSVLTADAMPAPGSDDRRARPDLSATIVVALRQDGALALEERVDGPILWDIKAGRVGLATGRTHLLPIFENNDLPGVMLASAVADYVERYEVLPGRQVVISSHETTAARATRYLEQVGANVTVLDSDDRIVGVVGRTRVEAVRIATQAGERTVSADLIAVDAGSVPRLDLLEAAPAHRPEIDLYGSVDMPETSTLTVPAGNPWRQFVDVCNDVTVGDLALAVREGFAHPEHVKRYTTAAMGPDQGVLARHSVAAALSHLTGHPVSKSRRRMPIAPIPLGALSKLADSAIACEYQTQEYR